MQSFLEITPPKNTQRLEWTEERIQKFWDFESRFPHRYFTFHNGDALLRLALRRVGHHGLVVDYGAGSGILFQKLLQRGITTAAIEISEASRAVLNDIGAKFPRCCQGVFAPDEATERLAGKCSVIYLVEVIEHLDAKTREEVLRHIHSLLKPGGYLVLTTPNDEKLEDSLILSPSTGEFFHRWQHLFSFTSEDMAAILAKFGFSKADVMTCYLARSRLVAFAKVLRGVLRGGKETNLVAFARK